MRGHYLFVSGIVFFAYYVSKNHGETPAPLIYHRIKRQMTTGIYLKGDCDEGRGEGFEGAGG